ncbi:cell envelope integrity protein TolA [Aliivibrio sp. 1S128]|uniref:cell envelope integrity protein TolA n=1 Tax=Aliivibrio sp. 1S128 TaxID=1840085 RepID=UPI00080D8EEC|nr:cell envelope integrity protein TolA [Aliivibrio sp. 1S128]OCH15502.1 protein TolA [Aliivibrio sp. 1S128]
MKSDNNYTFAIIVSVVLHLLLVAALLLGSDFSMDEKKQPNTIQAVVIDPNTIAKQASQIRQERDRAERAENERLKRLKQQSDQLEKNRKAEEDRIRKLKEQQVKEKKAARKAEDDRKKAAVAENDRKRKAETAAKVEAARVAKVKADKEKAAKASAEKARVDKERAAKAEKERLAKEKIAKEKAAKADADKKAKAEAERVAKAKAAAEKARKDKERAIKAEAERKQKEAALNDIFAGLEDETVQNSSAKQQHIDDEVNRYGAIYTQMIKQNLLTDQAYIGKACNVRIKLSSTGLLLNVTTLSGDAQVCRATKTAATKVNVFPMPTDGDVVTKLTNINLKVVL